MTLKTRASQFLVACKLAFVVATIALLSIGVFQPASAYAYDQIEDGAYAKVSCQGEHARSYYCHSVEDTMNAVDDMVSSSHNPMEEDDVSIDLMQDWDTNGYGVLKFEGSGKHYTLNLHGHVINRGISNPDSSNSFTGEGNGEVIRVCENASLDVVGSEENNDDEAFLGHHGKDIDLGDDGTFWKLDQNETSSTIFGGLITGGACDDSLGGGGFTVQKEASLNLTRVTVAGNVADTWNSSHGCGAGIAQAELSKVVLKDSSIKYNHAEGWGGGIYIDKCAYLYLEDNSRIEMNTSEKYGGGLAIDPGESDCDLSSSTVALKGGSAIEYNIAKKAGGGIYDDGSVLRSNSVNFSFKEDSSVSHNTSGEYGGGIAIVDDCNVGLDVINSHVDYNKAATYGGGIYTGSHWEHTKDTNPIFRGSTSTLSFNEAGSDGGGMYIDSSSSVCVQDSRNNHIGTAKIEGNKANGNGGGIAVSRTDKINAIVFDSATVFKNNSAGGQGGAIWLGSSCKANLTTTDNKGGLTFEGNSASAGGAIYNKEAKSSIAIFGDSNKTTFTNNHAASRGGAIYVSSASEYATNVTNAEFEGNYAGQPETKEGTGGAIWFANQLSISNTTISGNYATKQGGGVYCDNGESNTFTLGGTVLIDGNSIVELAADGSVSKETTRSNLSIKGSQKISGGAGDNALTTDSSIGVTVEDYSLSKRQLTANADFVTQKLGSLWPNCIYSDNTEYSILGEFNYLYLYDLETTTYSVVAYSAQPTRLYAPKPGETVVLKSSDFVKKSKDSEGAEQEWTLVSWDVTSKGKTKTIEVTDGQISFTAEGPTIARANYACAIKKLGIELGDIYSYDKLTSSDSPEKGDTPVYKTALSLGYIDSTSKVVEYPGTTYALYVTNKAVEEEKDGAGDSLSKKVTYTISIPKSTLASSSLFVDGKPEFDFKVKFNKYSPAGSTEGLGEYTASEVSDYRVTDDGGLEFKVSVTVPKKAAKHKVTFVANAMSPYYMFEDEETKKQIEVEDGQPIDFSTIPTPVNTGDTEAKFAKWFLYDTASKKDSVWYYDAPVTDDITLYALFSTQSVGDIKVTFMAEDTILSVAYTSSYKEYKVSKPSDPERENYSFDGWYADESCTTEFDFDSEIKEDTIVYAKLTHEPCTVTFDYDCSDIETKSEEVAYGGQATEPEEPKREGYEFLGWYSGASKYSFDTPVTKDITLTAKWERATCEVSFNTGDGGPEVESKTVTYGEYLEQPEDPTWAGHIFKGWYADEGCTDEFDFEGTPITKDTVVYAKWEEAYTVTLKFGNGDEDEVRTVKKGDSVGVLPEPSYVGHSFTGWYDADDRKVEEDTEVTKDMVLSAKWELNTYTVEFDLGGAEWSVDPQTVKYGKTATKPSPDPEREGFTFKGWFKDKAATEEFDFDELITGDTTLYAKWDVNVYKVSFDLNGAEGSIDPQEVEYGSAASKPKSDPEREGFVFEGWFKDAQGTEEFNFDEPVKADTTIYAKWTELLTVSFDAAGGTEVEPVKVKKGSSLGSLPETTKEGFKFAGWYNGDQLVTADTLIEENLELEAHWVDASTYYTVTFKDEDSVYLIESVKAGESVAEPAAPTKDGYIFKGWQIDGVAYDFARQIDSDITLVAAWEEQASDDAADANNADNADDNGDDGQGKESSKESSEKSDKIAPAGDFSLVMILGLLSVLLAAGSVGLALMLRNRKTFR